MECQPSHGNYLVAGDKFEAAGFVGNQVQDPNTPDLTKIWQKSKLIHAKRSK